MIQPTVSSGYRNIVVLNILLIFNGAYVFWIFDQSDWCAFCYDTINLFTSAGNMPI